MESIDPYLHETNRNTLNRVITTAHTSLSELRVQQQQIIDQYTIGTIEYCEALAASIEESARPQMHWLDEGVGIAQINGFESHGVFITKELSYRGAIPEIELIPDTSYPDYSGRMGEISYLAQLVHIDTIYFFSEQSSKVHVSPGFITVVRKNPIDMLDYIRTHVQKGKSLQRSLSCMFHS